MKKFGDLTSNLEVLVHAREQDMENPFVMSGILNQFPTQFELGWKVLKAPSEYEGMGKGLGSPRGVIKAAYQYLDFMDGDVWLSMLKGRNDTVRLYDDTAARALTARVIARYVPEFQRMRAAIEERYGAELENL
ncbi:MAG: HI0074 family nucleotidyltransferase substrate-binding subunit [Fretibacterium sp.]|nr:HI0074 family nucleotidyltransferase substrate-binding subunit [Fretibacterium sp.]